MQSVGGALAWSLLHVLPSDTPVDVRAATTLLALVLAAALTLLAARRCWPACWALGELPGFGVTAPRHPSYFAVAVSMGVAALLASSLLTQWLAQGQPVEQDIKQLISGTPTLRVPFALVAVGVGPLVEELLFRGVLLSALSRHMRVMPAAAITAVVFAGVHLPGLGHAWFALPGLALLALLLGWLRVRSGSIWPAVLAHGVHNLLATVLWFQSTP